MRGLGILSHERSLGGEWVDDLLAGFAAYYLTTMPVLLGVLFGIEFLHARTGASFAGADPIAVCINFDAVHYLGISDDGYSYDPAQGSVVAYFPAYPLLLRWICQVTGLPLGETALLLANCAFLGACMFMARYVRVRWPEATPEQRALVLAVFGLWPLGLFFRMPYPESIFVCGTLAVLYGMARGWPLPVLALLTGLVTAVRPVGVALTVAFVWYALTQPGFRLPAKAIRAIFLAPLACWGLLAYMEYQWLAFATPWAFAQTQEHWTFLAPEDRSWPAKFRSLATLEPVWGVYMPSSRRYWGGAGGPHGPLFNLLFWNPILFVLSGVLLLLGGLRRWFTGSELILGVGLLAIPYLTRSFEMSMASHGRFAAVVVVNYLAIGRLLTYLPRQAAIAICTALALFLCLFTSLYVAGQPVF
jgi:hypothetical protein